MMLKLLATFTLLALHGVSGVCPPDDFDSLDSFDLASYGGRWYSIKQIVTTYQPKSQFYCVYAEYEVLSRCFLCGNKDGISVFNRALRRSVKGWRTTVHFRAVVQSESQPARAFVGPWFLPFWLIGGTNYWVVAAGTYDDLLNKVDSTGTDYEWAIITTGPIDQEGDIDQESGNTLCYADGGMWMFSREAVPSQDVIDAIDAKALDMGLDTSKWLPVEQAGCRY
jgi:lipocalin